MKRPKPLTATRPMTPSRVVKSLAEAIRYISSQVIEEMLSAGDCEITVTRAKKGRRPAQNRLLWLWNGCIQAHMAETTETYATTMEWHETLCKRLRPDKIKGWLDDEPIMERFRTSDASVEEMTAYLNELNIYCQQHLGLILPLPDDLRMALYGKRIK